MCVKPHIYFNLPLTGGTHKIFENYEIITIRICNEIVVMIKVRVTNSIINCVDTYHSFYWLNHVGI